MNGREAEVPKQMCIGISFGPSASLPCSCYVITGKVHLASKMAAKFSFQVYRVHCLSPVSSIYIWSKNFSHSSKQKSEAKYGGNWRSYSTSVSVPCATIALNIKLTIDIKYPYFRAGDWNWRTIAFNFRHLWLHFQQPSSYSRYIWSSLPFSHYATRP